MSEVQAAMMTRAGIEQEDKAPLATGPADMGFGVGSGESQERFPPESVRLLWALAAAKQPAVTLEIGCGCGTATVWLVKALRYNEGRLFAFDPDADKMVQAKAALAAAGGDDCVTWVNDGYSPEFSSQCGAHGVDMAVIDGPKDMYEDFVRWVVRIANPGCIVAVDNVVSHRDQLSSFFEFLTRMEQSGCVEGYTVPVGCGILILRVLGKREEANESL